MRSLDEIAQSLRSTVEHLCLEIGPRSIYNYENLRKAAEFIKNALKCLGYSPVSQRYSVSEKEVENIIVFLGGAPGKPYFLLGAHYDTVSSTPGADDNASGVAVTLEVLRLIKERLDVEPIPSAFVFFTLEEPPFFGTSNMGSRKYALWARKSGHEIKGAIVLEMVGYFKNEPGSQKYPPFIRFFRRFPDTGNFIGIIADTRSKKLLERLLYFFEGSDLPVEHITVWLRGFVLPQTRLSDNASFWDKGYPSVMVTDTAYFRNPYYHTPHDTPEKLDYTAMARLAKILTNFFLHPLD